MCLQYFLNTLVFIHRVPVSATNSVFKTPYQVQTFRLWGQICLCDILYYVSHKLSYGLPNILIILQCSRYPFITKGALGVDWMRRTQGWIGLKKKKREHCRPCGQIHCACHALLSPCRVPVGRAAEKQQLNRTKPAERGAGCDLWPLGLIHRIYPWSHPPAQDRVSLSLSHWCLLTLFLCSRLWSWRGYFSTREQMKAAITSSLLQVQLLNLTFSRCIVQIMLQSICFEDEKCILRGLIMFCCVLSCNYHLHWL